MLQNNVQKGRIEHKKTDLEFGISRKSWRFQGFPKATLMNVSIELERAQIQQALGPIGLYRALYFGLGLGSFL